MYCTEIKRAANHPVTGKAQFKVLRCELNKEVNFCVDVLSATYYGPLGEIFFVAGQKVSINKVLKPSVIYLKTNKPYRPGNLINPRRALGIPKKAS